MNKHRGHWNNSQSSRSIRTEICRSNWMTWHTTPSRQLHNPLSIVCGIHHQHYCRIPMPLIRLLRVSHHPLKLSTARHICLCVESPHNQCVYKEFVISYAPFHSPFGEPRSIFRIRIPETGSGLEANGVSACSNLLFSCLQVRQEGLQQSRGNLFGLISSWHKQLTPDPHIAHTFNCSSMCYTTMCCISQLHEDHRIIQ